MAQIPGEVLGRNQVENGENEAYPSMLPSETGDCNMLIHIDALLIVGSRKTILDELIPAFQAKCAVSVEIMSAAGDELTFLKKTHQLLDHGRMIIKIHPKHLEQL